MPDETKYNLNYRPATYWPSKRSATFGVKGEWRRRTIRDAEEAGELDDVPVVLQDEALSDAFRTARGRIHPGLMGGEYLPDYGRDEVEIARVSLESTTWDVYSLRARPTGGAIEYSVVDEYQSDLDFEPKSTAKPLTLREMIDFIESARHPGEDPAIAGIAPASCRAGNMEGLSEGEEEMLLGFATVTSDFYPQLQQWYEEEEAEWIAEVRARRPADPPERAVNRELWSDSIPEVVGFCERVESPSEGWDAEYASGGEIVFRLRDSYGRWEIEEHRSGSLVAVSFGEDLRRALIHALGTEGKREHRLSNLAFEVLPGKEYGALAHVHYWGGYPGSWSENYLVEAYAAAKGRRPDRLLAYRKIPFDRIEPQIDELCSAGLTTRDRVIVFYTDEENRLTIASLEAPEGVFQRPIEGWKEALDI